MLHEDGPKTMNYDQAKQLLFRHGSGGPAGTVGFPSLETGFLGCLRPYSGLRERNFHEVIEALLVVGEQFHKAPTVERELIHAVWDICDRARRDGVRADGMLRRNKLIAASDVELLDKWIETIERTALGMTCGNAPHMVVHTYAEYVVDRGWSDNFASLLPFMEKAVSDSDGACTLEVVVTALGKLGPKASSVLPTLRTAELRKFDWYEPVERCTEEARGQIRAAIRAIEGEDR
jgi:hypothetical protein